MSDTNERPETTYSVREQPNGRFAVVNDRTGEREKLTFPTRERAEEDARA